jgi:hypothetical protein
MKPGQLITLVDITVENNEIWTIINTLIRIQIRKTLNCWIK